jgi:hypothetical protein
VAQVPGFAGLNRFTAANAGSQAGIDERRQHAASLLVSLSIAAFCRRSAAFTVTLP